MEQEFLRQKVSDLQQKLSSEEQELKQKKDIFLEKISFFSELSVELTQNKREYRRYEQELLKINEGIQKIDISEQDLDLEIAALENQLLEETNQEKKLKSELHQTTKNYSNYIQKMVKGFQNKLVAELESEKHKDREYFQQLQDVNLELKSNVSEIKGEITHLDHDLIQQEKDIAVLNDSITKQENSIKEAYFSAMLSSFNQLDINELEYIEQHVLDIDLYYAIHIRLALLAYKDKNFLNSYKHLSYLPEKILHWYNLNDFVNHLKIILIDLHSGIISPQRFLNLAKESSNLNQMEAYIKFSLLIEQGGDINKAYYILLGMYLDGELWIKLDEIYLKFQKFIRKDGVEEEKNLNVVQKIKLKMQESYASYCQSGTPSSLLKLQQLCSTELFKENSTIIINGCTSYSLSALNLMIIAHPEATQRDGLISALNTKELFCKDPINQSCSVFLSAWYYYAEAMHLNKMKKPVEAQQKLNFALQLLPYFQEARVFYEKLSPEFSWTRFFLDNKIDHNQSKDLEESKQAGLL